jgi:CubicO group peptidase (beta-lactamase class C family)
VANAKASCVELLRSTLPGSAPVTLAATSPSTGPICWSAGTLPDGGRASTDTQMYVASVTKQVVAALVGQAVLAHQLDPDTSVRRLLPALPAWAQPVQVRHLIHHTSGLPSTTRLLAALHLTEEAELDNALVVRALSRLAEPDDAPGRVMAYSNTGYVVLAEVLRAAVDADLAGLAQAAIFRPLGMTRSMLGQAPPSALPDPPPRTVGDGGLWTTARDLLRWLDGLNRGLLGEHLTDLLQTPGHLDDGTPLDYAWGMTARPSDAGITYTHGGNWRGWTAKTVRNPRAGTALALLARHISDQAVSDVSIAIHQRLLVA